ncbi:MAG: c-type cytochrome [Anaerolineaceae bacterium]|nr:c-type cytochrome [Anaerolineaceae bacterium]
MKMTFLTIVVGGVLVFLAVVIVAVFVPGLIWNPAQTVIAHPYTAQELRGRELFYSNGCNYCHTQYVREEDTAMGAVSDGGNYVFDDPLILGSERTGPDLSYIGRKRSEAWEIAHLKDPRSLSPLSIMPSFDFLTDQELEEIAAYLFALGNRVAEERMIRPPAEYAGMTDPLDYPVVTPVSGDQSQGWTTWLAADLQEGKEIYVENCLTCHGCAGNGLGSYGGTMSVTPADFRQEPFRNMPDDQWFWHVSEGVPGTLMPVWKTSLTEDQRWNVIHYIQQIFARPVMRDPNEGDPTGEYANLTNPLSPTVETLERGKAIFTRECMVCHGADGTGDGPYGNNLQPSPPDFSDGNYGTLQNPSYTDADYFWRISEGLPWSAMPTWKSQYSEEDRWALVYYIRVNFTQTLPRPTTTDNVMSTPEVYLEQTVPESASFERGKQTYLTNCAQCHGLAGDGNGWTGGYLDVSPSDFTNPTQRDMTDGEYLAAVMFGVPNTAMPSWGEWLPEDQQWDVIRYIQEAFASENPQTVVSLYNAGAMGANVMTLSQDNWTGEGHTISTENGQQVYTIYCSTCHGDQGQGDGSGATNLGGSAPAPFASDMSLGYIFWRVNEGIANTIMPPFNWLLSDADVWDVSVYVQNMTSSTSSAATGANSQSANVAVMPTSTPEGNTP